MARKVHIQYPGALSHVMNRGDRREVIFGDDEDRKRLLETLEKGSVNEIDSAEKPHFPTQNSTLPSQIDSWPASGAPESHFRAALGIPVSNVEHAEIRPGRGFFNGIEIVICPSRCWSAKPGLFQRGQPCQPL
jgi:hypothetical protein